jgi:hypothetical protein
LLVGRSLQAGGGIRAGKLEAGEEIQCGGAIFAGELLQAGGSIKAAWSVEVEGELRAEDLRCGWELRGGGHVKLKAMPISARKCRCKAICTAARA